MNNQEVAHKWAHGESARTGNDNLHTDGVNLYSYSTVIAKNMGKGVYVVMNGSTSNSTNRHVYSASRAIPMGSLEIFAYKRSYYSCWNDCDFKDFAELANNLVDKLKESAEKYTVSKKLYIEGDVSFDVKQIKELWDKKTFRKMDVKNRKVLNVAINTPNTAIIDVKSVVDAICGEGTYQGWLDRTESLRRANRTRLVNEVERKRQAEQRRLERDEKRKKYLAMEDRLEAFRLMWYDGINDYPQVPYGYDEKEFFRGGNVLLRLNSKGEIQTSKGIRIGKKEAKLWWAMIQRAEIGKGFDFDTKSGHYTAHSYENGILTAGCHQIAYAEMERIMNQIDN